MYSEYWWTVIPVIIVLQCFCFQFFIMLIFFKYWDIIIIIFKLILICFIKSNKIFLSNYFWLLLFIYIILLKFKNIIFLIDLIIYSIFNIIFSVFSKSLSWRSFIQNMIPQLISNKSAIFVFIIFISDCIHYF